MHNINKILGDGNMIEFESATSLYNHIKPALNAKENEIKRNGYTYIKKEDIWNYLKEEKWTFSNNLDLYQMIDDILNVSDLVIDKYVKSKINLTDRKIYFEAKEDDINDKE